MSRRVLQVMASLTVLAVMASGTGCRSSDGARPVEAASPSNGSPTAEPAASTPSPAPPPSTTPSTVSQQVLRPGDTGPAVLALQQRLVQAGFWLGTPDGRYGPATVHAVTALQKATGLRRDGVAGPATPVALAHAARPQPRSSTRPGGGGGPAPAAASVRGWWSGGVGVDTSTGRVAGTTPRGHFSVSWAVDGYHRAPLGVLYRPRFFVGGVAVHGYPSVPPYPASQGCVR